MHMCHVCVYIYMFCAWRNPLLRVDLKIHSRLRATSVYPVKLYTNLEFQRFSLEKMAIGTEGTKKKL